MTHAYEPVLAHVDSTWERLVRSTPEDHGTSIGLPGRYLAPSDRTMFQEMYYWDSYFTSLGLIATAWEPIVVDMAENMAYLLERFGVIPNASRFYFLSRSQPPFFTRQVLLAWSVKERLGTADFDWLARMTHLAETEHDTVWMGTAQPHHRQVHEGLSRYFDINYLDALASCESGWDHSTRCDDRWLDHLPVDLNSILAVYEADLVTLHTMLGDSAAAERWAQRRAARVARMQSLFWSPELAAFLDYDYVRGALNPMPSLAMFFPLWAGIATAEQADALVSTWFRKFLKRGGLVTSLRARKGRQWAYPNGWAPLQWICVEALRAYGFDAEAATVMQRWCDTTTAVYAATGAIWEKLNVVRGSQFSEEGLYGAVTGFGWSNGVFTDFARRLSAQ